MPILQIDNVLVPAVGDRDIDDLRQSADSPNPFPPEFYVDFLRNKTIMQQIGAQVRYSECSDPVGNQFGRTGDDARTLLPQLAALANARMKILIWVRGLTGNHEYKREVLILGLLSFRLVTQILSERTHSQLGMTCD